MLIALAIQTNEVPLSIIVEFIPPPSLLAQHMLLYALYCILLRILEDDVRRLSRFSYRVIFFLGTVYRFGLVLTRVSETKMGLHRLQWRILQAIGRRRFAAQASAAHSNPDIIVRSPNLVRNAAIIAHVDVSYAK